MDMTPAQRLRAAADKIRNTAEGCTGGPWSVDHPEYPEVIYGGDGSHVVSGGRWGGEANVFDNNEDAYHIALWHPGVAAAVAELLVYAANIVDAYTEDYPGATEPWLKLAQAILDTPRV